MSFLYDTLIICYDKFVRRGVSKLDSKMTNLDIDIAANGDYNNAIKCPIKGVDKCENIMYNSENLNICSYSA